MAGIIDKMTIKKINKEIDEIEPKVSVGDLDASVLKKVFGKKGMLVRSCGLGNDRYTGFHREAKECRRIYKSRKYVALDKYINNIRNNFPDITGSYTEINKLQKKIKTEIRQLRSDAFDYLAEQRAALESGYGKDVESTNKRLSTLSTLVAKGTFDPKTGKAVLEVEINKNDDPEKKKRKEKYNQLVEKFTTEYNDLATISAALSSESSGFVQWVKEAGDTVTHNFREMISNCSEESPSLKAITLWVRVPWNIALTALSPITALTRDMSFVVDYRSSNEFKIGLQLKKDIKKLYSLVKGATKGSKEVRRSVQFLVEDREQKAEFSKDIIVCAGNMIKSIESEGEYKKNSEIRLCRRRVAELIMLIGKTLEKISSEEEWNEKYGWSEDYSNLFAEE